MPSYLSKGLGVRPLRRSTCINGSRNILLPSYGLRGPCELHYLGEATLSTFCGITEDATTSTPKAPPIIRMKPKKNLVNVFVKKRLFIICHPGTHPTIVADQDGLDLPSILHQECPRPRSCQFCRGSDRACRGYDTRLCATASIL